MSGVVLVAGVAACHVFPHVVSRRSLSSAALVVFPPDFVAPPRFGCARCCRVRVLPLIWQVSAAPLRLSLFADVALRSSSLLRASGALGRFELFLPDVRGTTSEMLGETYRTLHLFEGE